jgi:hypothetical protein
VVAAVARDLGVHDFAGQLLPTDKIARLAAIAMSFSSLAVTANALRLRSQRLPSKKVSLP